MSRTRRYPTSPPALRSVLDPAAHESVDAFLKNLKTHIRKLNAVFSKHEAEIALLERLYYKGKNQHRAALFWQRVSEARRYGHRLQELRIPALIESLRGSFYGEQVASIGTKALKGAWSHFPSASQIAFVLSQLRTCSLLLEQVRAANLEDVLVFILALQTGAFLQLMVVLVALVSKLDRLALDAAALLAPLYRDCHRVLQRLHPADARKVRSTIAPSVQADAPAVVEPAQTTASADPVQTEALLDEDLGQSISRPGRSTAARAPSSPTAVFLDAAVSIPLAGAAAPGKSRALPEPPARHRADLIAPQTQARWSSRDCTRSYLPPPCP
ncbi:hypothetical protein BV25DRAFT_1800468 [Artomyces pyxidatus]|uniref:Uncharacterized protein n=1 Tax=Artomyces pyxidatus TaxID=48021 RepID=A0ACB8T778_9AGAM|nr:hypothetical protein BV25DRAFT_1800468 [Artomyces pyxidatus]